MRVENIGTSKNIPDSPQRPGLAEGDILVAEVADIKGDKVYLKNQEGGAVFTAKLLSDIGVAVGDYVETVVDEASGGRYVLRVVDISRQSPFATEPEMAADVQTLNQAVKTQALLSTLAMLKNNPGADPKAAAFLSKHGLAGTAENIEAMSQMAKGPSAVTALLTQIIKSFGTGKAAAPEGQPSPISDAVPQNSQTTQTVVASNDNQTAQPAGQTAAQAGAGIAQQAAGQSQAQTNVAQNQAVPVQSQALPGGTVQNQAAQAGAVQTSISSDGPVTKSPVSDAGLQALPNQAQAPDMTHPSAQPASFDKMSSPVPQNQDADRMQTGVPATAGQNTQATQSTPQTAPTAETVPAAESGQAQTAPRMPVPSDMPVEIEAAAQQTAAEKTAAQPPEQNAVLSTDEEKTITAPGREMTLITVRETAVSGELSQKALDMFVRMDDAEKLAVHLKKAVREMPDQLKELKLLADDADNTVRETVAARLGQIEKQMSLMSEVKRFDCYQIPLQTGAQQQTTAELFVYKYRGSKKTVDPDNILILLGLDTQYMGRVETLVKTSGKSLSIEFNMEDMRLADEMRSDAAQLKEAVQRAGYTLSGVGIKQLSARTTVLNAEERFEKEADGSAGNLDIRV